MQDVRWEMWEEIVGGWPRWVRVWWTREGGEWRVGSIRSDGEVEIGGPSREGSIVESGEG